MTQPADIAPALKNVQPGLAVSEAEVASVRLGLVECARRLTSALIELEERRGPWLYRAREDAARAQQELSRALATLGTNDS